MKNSAQAVLAIWLGCLLLGGWWLASGIHLRSDLSLFLP
jgi:predicted exporter